MRIINRNIAAFTNEFIWLFIALISAMSLIAIPVPAKGIDGIWNEIGEWSSAFALMFTAHEYGHQRTAENLGLDISWNFNNGGPHWIVDFEKVEIKTFPQQNYVTDIKNYVQQVSYGGRNLVGVQQICPESNGIRRCGSSFKVYTQDVSEILLVSGGGFQGQQSFAKYIEGSHFYNKFIIASALNKIFYGIFPNSLQPCPKGSCVGDVKSFSNGNAETTAIVALIASGGTDLWRGISGDLYGQKSDWSLDFWQSDHGSPGLMFTMKF